MSPLSMPAPTATGITGLTYSDITPEANKKYFVRFGSVKNSFEKISDEIVVSTYPVDPLDSYVVSLLRFENDFTDEKGNIWTARGANTYVDGGVLHVDADNSGLLCANTSFLNFGAGAFCFETFIELNAASLNHHILRNNWNTWQVNGAILNVDNQRMRYVIYGPSAILATQIMTAGEWHHLAFAREANGMMRMFLDGVMLRADSYPTAVNFSYWGATLFQMGLIKSKGVRITKGHARYISNFTPPSRF